MMIPRSLVKHQRKSVGTKGGSGCPAVFMFPVRGAYLVQLQPLNAAEQRLCFGWVRCRVREWGAVQVSLPQRTSCCADSLMLAVQKAWIKPSGESEGVHEPGAWRRKELLICEEMELWGKISVG